MTSQDIRTKGMARMSAVRSVEAERAEGARVDKIRDAVVQALRGSRADTADEIYRADWSGVYRALEEAGEGARWPQVREAILELDPEADA